MNPEPIWLWNQRLRNKQCDIVTEFDKDLENLVERMVYTMRMNNGIGIAAPQIGVFKRLAVVHSLQDKELRQILILCNPCILSEEGEQTDLEGCLSIPGGRAKVTRANKIRFAFQDIAGNQQEMDAEGLLARSVQHECDHLMGKFFVDRVSSLRRGMVMRSFHKVVDKLDYKMFARSQA